MRWFASVAAFFGLATSAVALEPVEAYGNKFFNKDGSQFFMKGMYSVKGRFVNPLATY